MEYSYEIERYVGGSELGKPKLTEEEIKKYEIANGLTEIERSLVLLKKSNSTQRTSVLINLPKILRDYPEAETELLPIIFKEVLSWDEELQIECGASLAEVIEESKLSKEGYEHMYEFILESLESWNNAKWDVVYEQYIMHLENIEEDADKRREIIDNGVKLSLSLVELSQAIPSRWTGTRMMAMLSNIIDKEAAK